MAGFIEEADRGLLGEPNSFSHDQDPYLPWYQCATMILTAARSQEVRLAEAQEIDWDARLWTVPAAHMKANVEHVVPLSVSVA